MQHKIINDKKHILVEVSGDYENGYFQHNLPIIINACSELAQEKVLCDVTKVQDLFKDSMMDRFHLGKEIASKLGASIKLAVVDRVDVINGFSETVAVNRGANFKVFTDRTSALKWLH